MRALCNGVSGSRVVLLYNGAQFHIYVRAFASSYCHGGWMHPVCSGNVIYLDITWFISTAEKLDNLVKYMQEEIRSCLYNRYPSDKKIRNTVCAYGFP